MTEIDWVIVVLLVLSTVVGIFRGAVRETLSVVGWIAGILLALKFAGEIAEKIPLESLGYIPRVIIAAVLIVVACLFAVGLLGLLLRKMLEVVALNFEDRLLGALFGFARGVLVICACVFLFSLSDSVTSSRMWQQSVMISPAQSLIDMAMPYMPQWLQVLRGTGSKSALAEPQAIPSFIHPETAG
ncbi:MAG: CvpA family protein [Burkholderia sp.]|jgi:membrane protein required for colicin V production